MAILRAWYKYELSIRKKAYKSLRSQFSYLKKHIAELYEKPGLWVGMRGKAINTANDFFTNMGIYAMEDDIYWDVKWALLSWYRWREKLAREPMSNFWVEFNKNNPAITEYMDEFTKLQLSDNQWSIAWTTKRSVVQELQNWFKAWDSADDIAKRINELSPTLFSMARAKMIAVNESRKWFEYGNNLPMREIFNKWGNVVKMRQNMHDGKVSEQCEEDNAAWRIPFNQPFPSWNDVPPGHVNCRCHCQYELL